mmetsp:Transcript_24892/g.80526  ORF Transcript_24892/g.80526 Transcript_24892/m.80526 type:complete len:198 (-) Transcript_24892:393-986(-)
MLGSLDDRGTDHDEDKEILWREAVQAVFEAVVDGFANVDHCSTEGRALMSMDLQVLQFSLDKIHRARPTRGADYAGLYIKAFYFAENDLLDWIADNRPHYKERHMVNLLQARLGKANKKKTYLKDLLSFSTSSSSSSSSRGGRAAAVVPRGRGGATTKRTLSSSRWSSSAATRERHLSKRSRRAKVSRNCQHDPKHS